MIVIETRVPEDVYRLLQAHGVARESLAEQSRRLLAIQFYQTRVLSLGKSARLAGMDRWDFIELLDAHQVPVLDYGDEELEAEFAAVERIASELAL